MASYNNTFQRKEVKYRLSARQLLAILEALEGHMKVDRYGDTIIESRYYDTPHRELIERSLDKPLYKEKLRLRTYGPFSQASIVYVELKKKFKGIVYKRRVRMSAEGARHYASGMSYEEAQGAFPVPGSTTSAELAPGKIQIAREIDAFFRRYEPLKPSMLISCMREAWCPLEGHEDDCVDRITFDEDICYVDLMDESSVMRLPVTAPDQVVMEIKCAGGYPTWLASLLSSVGAYPRSFSKYGNAYKRVLAGKGAVQVRKSDSGKVSVYRVPTKKERAAFANDTLLGPSKGYEIENSLRLVS